MALAALIDGGYSPSGTDRLHGHRGLSEIYFIDLLSLIISFRGKVIRDLWSFVGEAVRSRLEFIFIYCLFLTLSHRGHALPRTLIRVSPRVLDLLDLEL